MSVSGIKIRISLTRTRNFIALLCFNSRFRTSNVKISLHQSSTLPLPSSKTFFPTCPGTGAPFLPSHDVLWCLRGLKHLFDILQEILQTLSGVGSSKSCVLFGTAQGMITKNIRATKFGTFVWWTDA